MTTILQRSGFPYRELDFSVPQDWLMMDKLKMKMCTLEEHLVASTPWDFLVIKPEGLTQKYALRTYDENILAPLCFFDTRMMDFEEKLGSGTFKFWNTSEDVDDMMSTTTYDVTTAAMRACCRHLYPAPAPRPITDSKGPDSDAPPTEFAAEDAQIPPSSDLTPPSSGSKMGQNGDIRARDKDSSTPTPDIKADITPNGHAGVSVPARDALAVPSDEEVEAAHDIPYEAGKSPLDGAIAASIAQSANELKVKSAASCILLIGGSSALKGLGAFIAERCVLILGGSRGSKSIQAETQTSGPFASSWIPHIRSLDCAPATKPQPAVRVVERRVGDVSSGRAVGHVDWEGRVGRDWLQSAQGEVYMDLNRERIRHVYMYIPQLVKTS